MKMVKDKQVLVAADFSGATLKNVVAEHLRAKGWTVTDIGVKDANEENPEMFHRVGLKAGAKISEGEFERALLFCGTGMGIHIAASKCPHVYSAVVESVPAAARCVVGNKCNVMAMGEFYVAPKKAIAMAEAFLGSEFGGGHENWHNFLEYHQLALDELEAFDYETFKANGFEIDKLGEVEIGPEPLE